MDLNEIVHKKGLRDLILSKKLWPQTIEEML